MASTGDIKEKLNDIYEDIERNVTRIYGRRDLHLAVDLVYHSPLKMFFNGELIKAYPELFIIGDTRCGKSQIATELMSYYQLGRLINCEGTSYAGIVGGVEKEHDKWVVKWGAIPMNNKRLLFLDEVTGLKEEDIANMSMLRSSGVAQMNKIKSEQTNAMTRLIWMCNPANKTKMNSEACAIHHIQRIVKMPEDQARFDFMVAVAENDVDNDNVVNKRHRKKIKRKYHSDMCRDLILWCWSRTREQVVFTEKAVDACYKYAKKMYKKYDSDFPLVVPTEQKIKLARLATGLAGRLFSCTEDGECILVKEEHVEFVHEFLNDQYDKPTFSYNEWSQFRHESKILRKPKKVEEILLELGPDVCRQLMHTSQMSVKDMESTAGVGREEATRILSNLTKYGAYIKPYTNYVKTPALIEMLKDITKNNRSAKEEF